MNPETPLRLLLDARTARRHGMPAVLERQRTRLADLVAFAREYSPYFRELYTGLPEGIDDPARLPVTGKALLMPQFDRWVTDREVTLDAARAFVDDPARVGQWFLGRHTLVTTSGTTGSRGLFVADRRAMAVATVLTSRMLGAWLTPAQAARVVAAGGRMAMVNATGGHFASAVAAARLRTNRLRRARIRVFSVHSPLPELVAELNAFRPAVLAVYAGTAALLAAEQEAGRLRIRPVLVALSAEAVTTPVRQRIATAFGAPTGATPDAKGTAVVREGYAATEVPFLSYSCQHHWLHVNSDWVVLEPVDRDHRPVPPGVRSHTVLVSNLANRVQPILRYDLGDSVLMRPDPCPCGDPLPAIRVHGRIADTLLLHTATGEPVHLTSLTLSALLDTVPGLVRFQLVHRAPATLGVRLRAAPGTQPDDVWQAVRTALIRLLAEHRLDHVTLVRDPQEPERSAGGKFRPVIRAG